MRFIDMLRRHDSGSIALIADNKTYTYGDLLSAANEVTEPGGGLWIINAYTVYGELVRFLGAKRSVPVISGARITAEIPQGADFAVMSSGSTGVPKLLFRTTQSWSDFFDEQNKVFGIDKRTVLFTHGSLCFSGTLNIVLGALYAGAAVVASKGRLTRARMADIDRYNANTVYLIPDKLNMLCRNYKCGCVKTVIAGSQSMGAEEAEAARNALGAEKVILYYGASEVSYISYLDILSEKKDRGCVGKPFDGIEISCEDGYLTINSDYGAIGAEMPYRMGDIIRCGVDGYLYFEGRHDDVLNIGGEKLSAAALESEIRAAGAYDACVFLGRSEHDREILCCAICGDITDKTRLPHMPKRWYRLNELPKNPNGKTDRAAVIKICEQSKWG